MSSVFLANTALSPRYPVPPLFRRPAFALTTRANRIKLFLRQTSRSLTFWRRVLHIWASFKVVQLYVAVQHPYKPKNWPRAVWDAHHEKAGQMMLDLCVQMKGFQVKAGQLIALQAFVPATIRKKLSMLHDEMPPMPASTAKNVINDELEKLGLSDKIFKSINLDQVLGSASIAQVHEAVLHEGNTHVAVKVQYPDMERIMMIDLANFRILGEVLQRTELNFDLITPIQEIAHKLAMEFDFVSEARGMNEIRYALRKVKGVNVPESIPGMVSRRLLVMTYLDGMPLTKLDEKLGNLSDKAVRVVGRKILKKLSACYGKMILTDGFFQADCHPGNILLQNSKLDIGLLDFGQTKRFTRDRRLGFARLVDAMARKDTHGIARYLESLDIKVTSTKRQQERQTLERKKGALTVEEKFAYCLFDTAGVRGVSENPFAKDSALQYGSFDTLPRDLVFLLRTMQIMRGICKATKNPDYSMVASWGRRARSEIQNGAVAL